MPHSGNHRSCSRLCLSRAPWRCWVWPLLELVWQRIVAARPKELSPRERFVLFRQLHPETGGAALFFVVRAFSEPANGGQVALPDVAGRLPACRVIREARRAAPCLD